MSFDKTVKNACKAKDGAPKSKVSKAAIETGQRGRDKVHRSLALWDIRGGVDTWQIGKISRMVRTGGVDIASAVRKVDETTASAR